MLRPALLALLVAVAFAATPAVSAPPLQPGVEPRGGSAGAVTVLELDGPVRSNVTTPTLDVAVAVATQREAARSELTRRSLEVAFESAPDEATRRAVLDRAVAETGTAVSSLRADRRDLRASFVSRDVSVPTFLGNEAVLEARAVGIRGTLETISTLAGDVPGLSLRSEVRALDAGLTGFGGPITTRAAASITGESPPTRLYVSSSANGTALSMLDQSTYVRQSLRSDRWDPESSAVLRLDDIETRAGEIYPTAFDSNRTTSRGIQIVGAGVYRIEIGYVEGTIVAYLDGDTRDVFYEVQRQPLDLIEPGPVASTRENGSRLLVNRTFAGGPLRVAVVDDRTGEPVEATVTVGSTTVRTGQDGVVWTVMPGPEARVTATTASGETALLVRATQPGSP